MAGSNLVQALREAAAKQGRRAEDGVLARGGDWEKPQSEESARASDRSRRLRILGDGLDQRLVARQNVE